MIKLSNQVPSVYTSASRDFQYLSWLIDIMLNSVKHNVDDLYNLPENEADTKLTELLALTLGFKVKRNYDQAQLKALVAALPRILKYKGTKTALEMAGNALIAASGARGEFAVQEVTTGEIRVTLPEKLVDISLFTDLLEYILPAGVTCRIDRTNRREGHVSTILGYREKLQAALVPDFTWDGDKLATTGLAHMFEIPADQPSFSNFNSDGIVNIGLLSNEVIPALANTVHGVSDSIGEPDYTEAVNDLGTTVIINNYTDENNDDGITTIIGGK